ncbi:MAG: hypothetical protein OMM_03714 [Candidatus Magnetoglobus multicellularis str. Araruama]|uniref:Uncharacterized protein n=1 Tax=Candidatus Magnetoglobus multicellularis str. Araruama TaxID=890399 RepID=A0A1V1P4D7_9BACT|nr:MAG: hypothetical protein OMM_03714 [Candidatus Magnetoglobus multicellularis str. Araruama]
MNDPIYSEGIELIYILLLKVSPKKKIFPSWIKILRPELAQVFTLGQVLYNISNVFPCYYDHIESAIDTINSTKKFDKLIISIYSEEQTKKEKYLEVSNFLLKNPCISEIKIIVQHFCLETWLLGNKKVGPRNPKTQELKIYKQYFDVFKEDPDLLPDFPNENLNRAQFAFLYLFKKNAKRKKNELYKSLTKGCLP